MNSLCAKTILWLLIPLSCWPFTPTTSVAFNQNDAVSQQPPIETTYDSLKDRTTVRLLPVKISGERGKYHSLHMSPSFSYSGHKHQKPLIVDFELQTVVKGRLRTDLYVVFVIDGETIFLSSNRWGVKRPVPGRVWMGERLVFNMPYETFMKLARANHAAVKFDSLFFEFDEDKRGLLKALAEKMSQ